MKLTFPVTIAVSLLVVVGLLATLYERPRAVEEETLLVFCSAGLQKVAESVVADYRREFPQVSVRLLPGATGHLMPSVLEGEEGDLFLSTDAQDVAAAHAKGRIHERIPVAVVTPVLAVRKGNEAQVTSLQSLLDPRWKIGLGIPEKGPMIGKVSKQILERAKLWPQVQEAVQKRGVFCATVHELASGVKIGTIDVAIIFDGILHQYPDLVAVPIPAEVNLPQQATVGVLATSRRPTQALHFARYLTARDRGLTRFREQGYVPADGDAWADRPRLRLMSGGILRPAIEQTIQEFEAREGVQIDRNYAGCGTLVSSIRAGDQPDAFFACERSFLDAVQDRFLAGTDVSRTKLLLVVPKGNPANVRTIADLTRPGLRVGLANEASALGVLSQRLLSERGLWQAVQKNVVVQTPTADFLMTFLQVQAGRPAQLDAVIAYEVNARRVAEHVDLIEIPEASAPVVQPFAVAKSSEHRQLMERLLEAIRRGESRQRFEASGFAWQ